MSGRSQGSVTRSDGNKVPAGAGLVTAASEGLSLSGTTVQLGNASILSALPAITATRHIPMNVATVISLNSSNIATPANRITLAPTFLAIIRNSSTQGGITLTNNETAAGQTVTTLNADATLTMVRTNAAGTLPNIVLNDSSITGTSTTIQPALVTISGSSVQQAILTVNGQTPLINLTGSNIVADPIFTISKSASTETNIQTHQGITLTAGAGPKIIVNGTNAAGAVFASQFRNTSTAAAATVNMQMYIDSSVADLEIIKHSNAHATFPSGTLIQQLGAVANSQLCLRSSSSGGAAFITSQIGTVEVARQSLTGLTLGLAGTTKGTLLLAGNTSGVITIQPQAAAGTYNFNLPITAGSGGDILTSGGGGAAAMAFVAPAALTGLPYIALTGTSTLTGNVVVDTIGAFSFLVTQGGSKFLQIDKPSNLYSIGDIDAAGNGFFLQINDAAERLLVRKGSSKFLDIDKPSAVYQLGDINATNNGFTMLLSDSSGIATFNNSINNGAIQTGIGTMNGVTDWKFGTVINAASVVDATKYVEVEVGTILVKLAIIV